MNLSLRKFKKAIYAWWWDLTHVKAKPPNTIDILIRHLYLLEQYYEGVRGKAKPIGERRRYKAAIASRRKKIEELGVRSPKTLEETRELRGWILGGRADGYRYGS